MMNRRCRDTSLGDFDT